MLLTFLESSSFPQTDQQKIEERVDVQVVNVNLTVRDKKGNYVYDLKPDDLIVREDGVPQEVLEVSSYGDVPIALRMGFLFDNSWSMSESKAGKKKIDIAKGALRNVLNQTAESDSLILMLTNPLPSFEEGPIEDKKRIHDLTQDLKVQGGVTLLFDRLAPLIKEVSGKAGRRIIVIFSDGQDSGSRVKIEDILQQCHASDVTVVAIGTTELDKTAQKWWINAEKDMEKGKLMLQDLSAATGGVAFFPSSPNDVPRVLPEIQRFLNSQYSVAYHSKNVTTSGWRSIEITSKRPNLRLIYRKGYFVE